MTAGNTAPEPPLALPTPAWIRFFHIAAVLLLPWWNGGAFDSMRYTMVGVLLLGSAVWIAQRPPYISPALPPALALLAWAFLQVLLVSRSPVSTFESALVLAGVVSVLVFWAEPGRKRSHLLQLAGAVVAVGLAEAVFGVLQERWLPHSLYGVVSDAIASPFGSFTNHNHFAGLVEMSALLAAGMAIGAARRAEGADPLTVVLAGIALAMAGAHLASRSRGGLVGLLAGAAVLGPLWILGRRAGEMRAWKPLLASVAVGLLLVGFGWAAVPEETRAHLSTVLQGPGDDSGRYRISMARASVALWRAHPVAGAGLGTYADTLQRFKRDNGLIFTPHGEDDVLEFAAEAGLVGVAILGWLLAAVLRGFSDRMTHGHDPLTKGIAVGALAGASALAVHSFFDFNLRKPSNALVFCALVGLAAAPRSVRLHGRIRWRIVGVALAVLLAAASFWRAAGALAFARAEGVEEPHARLAALDGVLRAHPYLPLAYRARAQVRWHLARGSPVIVADRLHRAEQDLLACLRLRPDWPEAWVDLGWVRVLEHDEAGARLAFARARESAPVHVYVGFACAEFYAHTGDVDRALAELHLVRERNSDVSLEEALAHAKAWTQDTDKLARLALNPLELKELHRELAVP